MGIVQTIALDTWERGGRFSGIEDYVTCVIVTEPQDDEGQVTGEHWSVADGPPPPLRYTQYERYDDRRGTGWEVVEEGRDYRNPDDVQTWHSHVGTTIRAAYGEATTDKITIIWVTGEVDRFCLLQPAPAPDGVTEVAHLARLGDRLRQITAAVAELGYQLVGDDNGRHAIFVYGEPSTDEVQRYAIETQLARVIGPHVPEPHTIRGWMLTWPEYGLSPLTVRLFNPCLEASGRVTDSLAATGFTQSAGWSDGVGVFAYPTAGTSSG